MSKIKPKRKDTFIDMTAMSDVTVLLLTFFMSTSTFLPKEPVKIASPSSVSETKIPESNIMTILVDKSGKIYMTLDRKDNKLAVLEEIGKDYNITFTPAEKLSFVNQANIGMPASMLQKFLDLRPEQQDKVLKDYGIPSDSTNNQLKLWIQHAVTVNSDIKIAIKADKDSPYSLVKSVLSTLQELKQYRYHLVTSLAQ